MKTIHATNIHESGGPQRALRRDPVQKKARRYFFVDLKNVSRRLADFANEEPDVRRQVLLELESRVEQLGAGRAASAWASSIQASVASVTITGALFIAVFNGWFATIVKMVDGKTGLVHGITEQQFTDTIFSVGRLIGWSVGILLLAALATLWGATNKDKHRSIASAWLHLFADAEAKRQSGGDAKTAARRFWRR